MAQLTPIQLLLPLQVQAQLKGNYWVDSVVAFGVISAIAGVCALITYPLAGALSDRTTSRFGRRRPWIFGGALLFAVGLLLLGLQHSLIGVGIFWCVALIGFCVLSAALTATISDQVPVGQRGLVSAWISAPQAIGTILGLVLVTSLELTQFLGLRRDGAHRRAARAAASCSSSRTRCCRSKPRPPFSMSTLIAGFWISPRKHPDFGWTLLGRILVNLGNALGTTLLLYFIMFGLHREKTAQDDLISLTLVYMFFVIFASILLGWISDQNGRRKIFVIIAAVLQALAALLLAFVPDINVTYVAAGLLGLGYGCFLSVDQALATQVLPDAHSRGKDLGIMNIATAVPQAIAPLFGAWVVAALAGFTGLFALSAIVAILGAIAIIPVKGVR